MTLGSLARPLAIAVAIALPASLAAQSAGSASTAETLPFRAGQWAAELSATSGAGSAAFLRFTAPGSAWLIAPGLSYEDAERTMDGPFGASSEFSSFGLELRVGRRGYRPLGRDVVSFLGLGVQGQMVQSSIESEGGPNSELDGWAAGLYGELGGTYFFTPRLGIGASATASFLYEQAEDTIAGGTGEITGWSLAFPATRLLVTIVF